MVSCYHFDDFFCGEKGMPPADLNQAVEPVPVENINPEARWTSSSFLNLILYFEMR